MPWKVWDTMSLCKEFVMLAGQPGADIRELCRRFGIGAKTGYKWSGRFSEEGEQGLGDRSRRPRKSPSRTPLAQEAAVLASGRPYPSLVRVGGDLGCRFA